MSRGIKDYLQFRRKFAFVRLDELNVLLVSGNGMARSLVQIGTPIICSTIHKVCWICGINIPCGVHLGAQSLDFIECEIGGAAIWLNSSFEGDSALSI